VVLFGHHQEITYQAERDEVVQEDEDFDATGSQEGLRLGVCRSGRGSGGSSTRSKSRGWLLDGTAERVDEDSGGGGSSIVDRGCGVSVCEIAHGNLVEESQADERNSEIDRLVEHDGDLSRWNSK